MIRTLTAVGLGAASFLAATPANAACVGEQSIFYVCAVLPTVTVGEHTYCVYAGGDECTDVAVPYPQTMGRVSVYCGGPLDSAVSLPAALSTVNCFR